MKALIEELGRRVAKVERAVAAQWRTPGCSMVHQSLLAHYHLEQQVNGLWEAKGTIQSGPAFQRKEFGPTWRYRLCTAHNCWPERKSS